MLTRLAVNQEPEYEPDETKRSDSDKRTSPTPSRVQPRHNDRREHGTKAGARVKDAGGQGTLLFWEPFCNRLDAGGPKGGAPTTHTRASRGNTTKGNAR